MFGVQLVALLPWSGLLYTRWGMTWDYGIRYQGWWGIAHGHLDPYSTLTTYYFWQDHFELINWPLAPLSLLWPGGLWAVFVQDVMIVGGELGALYLVVDAVRRPGWTSRLPGWVAVALVTVLLVANPWIYHSASFDFHYQSVGAACFAMLACREMIRGRMRLLVLWVCLCLACGDIAGTYLVAVGLGRHAGRTGLPTPGGGPPGRGPGLVLRGDGTGRWQGIGSGRPLRLPRPDQGGATNAKPSSAALVAGALTHPGALLSHLWQARLNIWAYASSSGGIGIFSPLAVLPALILFESGAGSGGGLRSFAYENFGAVLFLAPLSVLTLAWIARRLHHGGLASQAALARPAVAALALGAPGHGRHHGRQHPGLGHRVAPPGAGPVAAHLRPLGCRSRPGGRHDPARAPKWWAPRGWSAGCAVGPSATASSGPGAFPLRTADTYFVITPYSGIELASVQTELSMIGTLAGPLHATLLVGKAGVWLFRLHATPGQRSVTLATQPTLPAWAAQSATGRPSFSGPPQQWAMTLTGTRPGYLVYGASWDLSPGHYQETVTLATTITTDVEVWDASTDTLLSRRLVPASNGNIAVQAPVTDHRPGGGRVPFGGWGPFRYRPLSPATSADRIEIRVWTPGSGAVRVYSLEIQPLPTPRP